MIAVLSRSCSLRDLRNPCVKISRILPYLKFLYTVSSTAAYTFIDASS